MTQSQHDVQVNRIYKTDYNIECDLQATRRFQSLTVREGAKKGGYVPISAILGGVVILRN